MFGTEHLELLGVVDDCPGIDHAQPETSAAAGAYSVRPLCEVACEGQNLASVSDCRSDPVANRASAPFTVEKRDTEAAFQLGESL